MARQIKPIVGKVPEYLPRGVDESKIVNANQLKTSDYFRQVNSPLYEDHGEYNPPKTTQPKNQNNGNGGSNTGGGNTGGGIKVGSVGGGNSIADRMNSQFQVSQSYLDAMNYTQSLLDKINSGRTSYTDQLNDIMNQISNREKFSYDMSKDTMFQEYLSEMMGSGQTAMRDTIGQASALTGGYGSSYATVAGNQAYNSMIQDAYSNLPEYYNMALNAYNAEGEQLMNQYGMLSQADATEYGRLMDAYNANYNQAQNMYGQEYQRWMDDVNNAFNLAKFAEEQRQFNAEMGYKNASLAQSQKQWEAEMAYKKQRDEASAVASAEAESQKEAEEQEKAHEKAMKKYDNDKFIQDSANTLYAQYESLGFDDNAFNEWLSENGLPDDVPDEVNKKILDLINQMKDSNGAGNNGSSQNQKPSWLKTYFDNLRAFRGGNYFGFF